MGHFGHRREAWHGIAGRTAIEAAVQPVTPVGDCSCGGILHQALRKIAGPVHDALDAQDVACLVEDEMLMERAFRRETADAREFRRLEMPAQAKVRVTDGVVHGFQISFGYFLVRIFQIPAVLQGEVMLCPQRDDDGKTHALAF